MVMAETLEFPEDALRVAGVRRETVEEYRRAWVGAGSGWRRRLVEGVHVEGGTATVALPGLPGAGDGPDPVTPLPVPADGAAQDPATTTEPTPTPGPAEGDDPLATVRGAREYAQAHPEEIPALLDRERASGDPRKSLVNALEQIQRAHDKDAG